MTDRLPPSFCPGCASSTATTRTPASAAVINTPGVPADEWTVDGEHTVASYPGNEPYLDDPPIAVVVFPDDIDAHGLAVDEAPLKLSELVQSP